MLHTSQLRRVEYEGVYRAVASKQLPSCTSGTHPTHTAPARQALPGPQAPVDPANAKIAADDALLVLAGNTMPSLQQLECTGLHGCRLCRLTHEGNVSAASSIRASLQAVSSPFLSHTPLSESIYPFWLTTACLEAGLTGHAPCRR